MKKFAIKLYPDSRINARAHFFSSCCLNMESPTCCSGPGK